MPESSTDTLPHLAGNDATGPHRGPYRQRVLPRPGLCLAERYQLLEPLGRGASGWVWKARHTVIGKHFAVKLLASHGRAESAARMLREARTLSRFDHPNVIAVTDFGYLGDADPYIVMELLEGESLQTVLARGRIAWSDARRWGLGIVEGLEAAHAHGVVHRDVKPGNLFVTAKHQRIKVIDFGLAALRQSKAAVGTRITMHGDVFGTPLYMSPEQAQGQLTDARTDIYSVGCVLYEMLGGRPPVQGDPAEALYQHVYAQPPPLRSLAGPEVPTYVCDVIHRCLAKNPDARPASMAALRAALLAGPGPRSRSNSRSRSNPEPGSRSRRRTLSWAVPTVAAAATLLGVLGAAAPVRSRPQTFEPTRIQLPEVQVVSVGRPALAGEVMQLEQAKPKPMVKVADAPVPAPVPQRRSHSRVRKRRSSPRKSDTPKWDTADPDIKDPFAGRR